VGVFPLPVTAAFTFRGLFTFKLNVAGVAITVGVNLFTVTCDVPPAGMYVVSPLYAAVSVSSPAIRFPAGMTKVKLPPASVFNPDV
jgi:quinol-cytochrome oxidoreductase complex cytochrome b subunit